MSGGCREHRGLLLLPAACVRGGRRLFRRPSESPWPGTARPSSRVGQASPATGFSGLAAARGAGAGSAARELRRGLQGPAAPGGDKAPTGRARRRARGAGRPAGSASRGAGPGPRRSPCSLGLSTSSWARGWARGAAPRTLPPGLLTKPLQVGFHGPSSFSPHPSRLPAECLPALTVGRSWQVRFSPVQEK